MFMGLTRDQFNTLCAKMDKEKEDALSGKGTFKMDKIDCSRFFNVTNDTWHRPLCRVEKTGDNKSYVKAIFFGSGLLSHPVYSNWVANSAIESSIGIPYFFVLWCKIKNIVSKPEQEEFEY